MGRVHLFELLDQDWYPTFLADAGRAYLHRLEELTKVGKPLAEVLEPVLEKSGTKQVLDLGSGSGGPALLVHRELKARGRDVSLVLSDLHPDTHTLQALAAEDEDVRVETSPVDATAVPEELSGARTLYNALHHFRPDDAKRVLRDAMKSHQPIVVAELSGRTFPNLITAFLVIPIMVLLLMPTVRPLRLSWLLFTYVIPILPLAIAWDGFVSHLRVYSPKELGALTADLSDGYEWTTDQVALGPGAKITTLVGLSKASE